jgi:glycosyltransferase involved in cell wall biosynthesis
MRPDAEDELELSIVMPCLNEEKTLARCIEKAKRSLRELEVRGEVIVADNGSTDGSVAIAQGSGARVVHVDRKGYGSALNAGIEAACGKFVIIGDADESYDFGDLGPFLLRLREGYDLVMGNRFQGRILPEAMPPLHRYFGNPILSGIGRTLFRVPVGDFHCGLRGFRRDAALRMNLQTTGMEFASEMVVKATLLGLRITEVPITLYPDGRGRASHLRTFRDGWRHLRFLLLYSPRWLFFYPGLALLAAGLLLGAWVLPAPRSVGGVTFDVHSLAYAAAAVLLGYQSIAFAIFTKVFAIQEGLLAEDPRLNRLFRYVTLETGLAVGFSLFLIGLAGSIWALGDWGARSFGELDPRRMLRIIIPASLALTLGLQIVLSSFFLSVLGLGRHRGRLS